MFHICRTIRQHFSLRQVKLCIGQRKYKQKFTTQGRINRSTNQASEFVLAHLITPILHFCKKVVKSKMFSKMFSKLFQYLYDPYSITHQPVVHEQSGTTIENKSNQKFGTPLGTLNKSTLMS